MGTTTELRVAAPVPSRPAPGRPGGQGGITAPAAATLAPAPRRQGTKRAMTGAAAANVWSSSRPGRCTG